MVRNFTVVCLAIALMMLTIGCFERNIVTEPEPIKPVFSQTEGYCLDESAPDWMRLDFLKASIGALLRCSFIEQR